MQCHVPDLAPSYPPGTPLLRHGSVRCTVFCLTAHPKQHLCRDEPWRLNHGKCKDKQLIKPSRAPTSHWTRLNTQPTVTPGQCQNNTKFQPVRRVLIPAQKGSTLHGEHQNAGVRPPGVLLPAVDPDTSAEHRRLDKPGADALAIAVALAIVGDEGAIALDRGVELFDGPFRMTSRNWHLPTQRLTECHSCVLQGRRITGDPVCIQNW